MSLQYLHDYLVGLRISGECLTRQMHSRLVRRRPLYQGIRYAGSTSVLNLTKSIWHTQTLTYCVVAIIYQSDALTVPNCISPNDTIFLHTHSLPMKRSSAISKRLIARSVNPEACNASHLQIDDYKIEASRRQLQRLPIRTTWECHPFDPSR